MMNSHDDIPPYLKKAADLYFQELGPHLDMIEKLARNTPTGKIPTENREEILLRFHTIRGGAGFLKLDQILTVATAGEKESEAKNISSERILELVEKIREIAN